MFFDGGGGLGTTGAVPTKIVVWVGMRSRRHLSTVLTSQSRRVTAAFHQRASLHRPSARQPSPLPQMRQTPVNVKLLVPGKEMQAWMTGASEHVAAVTNLAICAPARKFASCPAVYCRREMRVTPSRSGN